MKSETDNLLFQTFYSRSRSCICPFLPSLRYPHPRRNRCLTHNPPHRRPGRPGETHHSTTQGKNLWFRKTISTSKIRAPGKWEGEGSQTWGGGVNTHPTQTSHCPKVSQCTGSPRFPFSLESKPQSGGFGWLVVWAASWMGQRCNEAKLGAGKGREASASSQERWRCGMPQTSGGLRNDKLKD